MKSITFNIPADPVNARKIIDGAVWHQVKALTIAGHKLAIRIGDQSKSRDAEEKYHAMVGEIAKQVQVGGKLRDAETMKRLLVDQFKADTLHELADEWAKFGTLEMVPSLDGQRVVVLGTQTRHFSTKLATNFIEWLYAWGADAGVIFTEKFIDPETGEIVVTRREPKREATC